MFTYEIERELKHFKLYVIKNIKYLKLKNKVLINNYNTK